VHSLPAYFIRPGDPDVPIVYTVDRIRDGRSFTTRRVVVVQHGRPIFAFSASFQVAETGPEYQSPMPESAVMAPAMTKATAGWAARPRWRPRAWTGCA
jgi:acyl-CoA thioesterase II